MKLRNMTCAELDLVLGWAAEEGWNPGIDDAAAFHAADPAGYFVADIGGTPVAAISVVNHTDDFAFLGLYLCHPDYRGRGIGYALWKHALAHAGNRTVGLDGVPDQQENYRRSGFVLAARNTRFTGVLPAGAGHVLAPVTSADIPRLVDLEGRASGVYKPAFLREWLRPTGPREIRAAADGSSAFLTLRRCVEGYKIGPLVAPDIAAARALLLGAAAITGDAAVMIDIPGDQADLAALCTEFGMVPSFSTARMYRGPEIVPGPGIRAIATLELG